MIPVTKPFLPPLDEYKKYIDGIYEREWLTNNGPLVNELELQLRKKLDLKHLLFLANGTIALQLAIKSLNLSGEIITTPFSYVATSSSIKWEGCTPVYVDINKETLNIDYTKIESAITEKTSAILATHVYGNPCDIAEIEEIAKKHQLKVIYDAAHCFGTLYKGKSVFLFGDVSITSFHATKLFHTIEGGAIFSKDSDLIKRISHLRNFGHDGPESFIDVGINGKNSEFHAAMGLCNLNYVDKILYSRKMQSNRYHELLVNKEITFLKINKDSQFNFAYFPIILSSESLTVKIIYELEANRIKPRRYFYPSLNTTEVYKSISLENSDDISKRVLCLPLYFTLSTEEIDFVCRIILRAINN